MVETKQNTPVTLDLATQARSTGWTVASGIASHESCNQGYIYVNFPGVEVVVGQNYTITFQVANRTSGIVRLELGSTVGTSISANGNYSQTLVAGGTNPTVKFFSNGDLNLKLLDFKSNNESVSTRQKNTIVFSEKTNKYTTFYSFTSDYGFSMFQDLYTFKGGKLYKHDQSITTRNNIYGVQYDTSVTIPFNNYKGQPKTFEGISYEGNMLMITTTGGVNTSLGQVSELNKVDFLHETLNDGVNQIDIYNEEGIFSASFMRDKNDDINTGADLKGTYITVELLTTESNVLKLRNVIVSSVVSAIGTR